jgi:hypothetical protein
MDHLTIHKHQVSSTVPLESCVLHLVSCFFYNCRGVSTNRPYFLQNKPNFKNPQMNVSIYYTKVYSNETAFRRGKNKPKTNPICRRAELMQSTYLQRIMKENVAKDYEKQSQNKPNFHRGQNERNLLFDRELPKSAPPGLRENKPKINPIASVEGIVEFGRRQKNLTSKL